MMSQFEYWVAFISILLALAVADLMSGLGRIVRDRDNVDIYWVPVAWMVMMVVLMMQGWWSMWDMRSSELQKFADFFLIGFPRLLNVLVAFLLSPPVFTPEIFNLRAHYFKQIRWVAWLFVVSLGTVSAAYVVKGIDELWSPITAIRLVALAVLFSLGIVKHPRYHEAITLVLALLLCASFFFT